MTEEQIADLGPAFTRYLGDFRKCFPRLPTFKHLGINKGDITLYIKGDVPFNCPGVRWEVETHFRELKTTMKMRVLKCKSPDGATKELLAFALAYNLVRRAMNKAATLQQVDIGRISFIDTLRWMTTAAAGDSLPELVVNPLRPDRCEPRVIKRRAKQYDLMNRPRTELRKRLKQQSVAA